MLPTLGGCAARHGQEKRGDYWTPLAMLRYEPDDSRDRAVRGFGRTEVFGPHEVRHDPQHPLHERVAAHADAGELAHDRGVPDGAHEHAGDFEVEAVHLVEALGVRLEREAVAG